MIASVMDVNGLAVALAGLAYYLLGALWFTPLFGRAWDRSIGFERPAGNRFPARYYVTPLVSCLVVAVATATLAAALSLETLMEAAVLGIVVGVGYAASISVNNAITPHTPRPFLLGAITGGYHVVGIVLASVIIVAVG